MEDHSLHRQQDTGAPPNPAVSVPFLELAPEPFFWLELDGRFAYINEAACTISGYAKEEFLQSTAFDFIPQLTAEGWVSLIQSLRSERRVTIEMDFAPKSAPLRPVEINICLLTVDDKEYVTGLARDTSSVRQTVAEVLRKEEAAKGFAHRLTLLHEISTELSEINNLDDLCRQAVLLGRRELGFDRLGIWLLEAGTEVAVGTFGTDEQGALRDEHHLRDVGWKRELTDPVRHREVVMVQHKDVDLDFFGKPIGRADQSAAPLWDGKEIIGFLSSDNLLTKRPFSDHDNQLLRLYAETLGFLITQKRSEEALRHSEEIYRLLVENIPFCVTLGDTNYTIQKANTEQARLFNTSPANIIGKKCYAVFGSNTGKPCPNCAATKAMTSGRVIEDEYTMPGPDGTARSIHLRTFPLRNADGAVIGFLDVSEDVTARRLEEKERRLLSTAMQQSAEAILIMDLTWTIIFANPAIENLSQYPHAELLGQTHRLLLAFRPDAEKIAAIELILGSGEAWSGRIKILRKDMRTRVCEASFSPVRDAGGVLTNYVCALRDVTDLLELEQQLRQSQRMEAVGELAGGVAHDFNNLLQAIVGYTQMAMQEIPTSGRAYSDLNEANKACARAAQLVRQLLTFSRRKVIQPSRIHFGEVVKEIAKMLTRVIGEHIKLEIMIEPDLKPVYADQSQMEQVLMNLCVNARSAMPEGGQITINLSNILLEPQFLTLHPWARLGEFVCLSVQDNGVGMSPEVRDRIFEPFFTTKAVGEGTGLGLSIVYGIVKQHEGMIHVYSELGHGTTFRIYIPIDTGKPSTEEKDKVEKAAPGGRETILFAEDDEMVRGLAMRVLEGAGYEILVSQDGEEALRVFHEHRDRISLALLDVVMPKLSGRAVFDTIKIEKPEIPVLFCSGYSGQGLSKTLLPPDGFELMSKPFRPDALLWKVRAMLDAAAEKKTPN